MAENVTPVTLEVKDFEAREVMMVDYKFDQATDREGQIAGIPRGGRLKIRVKAMKTIEFKSGYCVNFEEKWEDKMGHFEEIEITCKEIEFGNVKFTNGYCVNYEEKWEDKMGHFEEFTITCKKIEFGNVVYENDWA